jgi:plastocyanin
MRPFHRVLAGVLALASFPAFATDHVVIARNGPGGRHFDPSPVLIEVNDTVTFKNDVDDLGFHNVKSDDGALTSFRCAAGCDGDPGGNGAPSGTAWTATVTFPTAGTIGYYCEIHGASGGGGMAGIITVNGGTPTPTIVVDPPSVAGAAAAGSTTAVTFTLANLGAATLDWTADTASADCATPDLVPWIAVDPASGSIDAAAPPQTVNVTLDATTLAEGVYDANVCLQSNDTAHDPLAVPVEFTVTPNDTIFKDGFDG